MHNNSSLENTVKREEIAVLVVAAGRGHRAGHGLPKQYRDLNGEMVLTKTLKCFLDGDKQFSSITVAIHPDDKDLFKQAIEGLSSNINFIHGGATRTASVKAGLESIFKNEQVANDTPAKFVLIHDAARPFLDAQTLKNVCDTLGAFEATAPCLPIVDAIKTRDGQTVDRDTLTRVQTPQGFDLAKLRKAYAELDPNLALPDDIAVAQHGGLTIGFCDGDPANIKLTHPEDFQLGKRTHMISITGSGYDVHRICAGSSLFLCGVEIKAGFSLKGHSDADVGLHALTDALLGAVVQGDIGDHFPPSHPKWKGANSALFLEHAALIVREKGGIIDHVDVTLICEKPKVKPHREAMRTRIADLLNIAAGRVSVKATTTEGLGFTGREEGIAASATASIRLPENFDLND